MIVKYDYEKFTLDDILSGKRIVVPPFQRNVVWNEKKRKEFIQTLKDGNPFGSILVHKDGDKYTLIDGLQRVSTIKDFSLNPYKYFTHTDINEELIYDLIKNDFESRNVFYSRHDSVAIKRCEEIQKFIFKEISENKEWNDIFYDYLDKFGVKDSREASKLFFQISNDLKEQMDIKSLIVPTIVYNGPTEELAEIFYHLNTGGVNLSKYETLSASWGTEKFVIGDEQIIDKIYEKYENIRQQSELEVEISKEELRTDGITIFEYCYAISEILRGKENKYELSVGKNKKSTDPVGFEILSLICGLNVNKAEGIYSKLKNCKNGKFFVDLKNAIVATFDTLLESLKPWIIAKNGEENTLDSTYMIYHMAMAYFRNNYKIDIEEYSITIITSAEWNKKYKKNLYLYYFKDYISDYWKKNRQVQDLMRELQNPDSLNKYTKTISNDEWNNALLILRDNQLQEVTSQINSKAKMFIDYLVKFKINENRTLEKYFEKNIDYEHIIPQQKISAQLTFAEKKIFPISSLGNICYLASKDNRSKHENTLYEYSEDRPSFSLNKEYLTLISYPSKEDINFIDNRSEEFKIRYRQFIEYRIDLLIEEMKKYLRRI